MSLSANLVAFLKAHSEVTALVGSGIGARIRPSKLKQGETYPALRFALTSGESVEALDGPLSMEIVDLQLDCYADTHEESEALRVAVRDALLGFYGDFGTGFVHGISNMQYYSDFESNDDASDKGNHRMIVTFNMAYSE